MKREFESVRRPFSPSENARFERGKRAFARDRAEIDAHAGLLKSQLEELRNAMQLLRQARENAGLSLADVAARSGIDKSRLSKLENDPHPNPTLNTLTRIANAIGVRLSIRITAA